jgi:hypothetical protein
VGNVNEERLAARLQAAVVRELHAVAEELGLARLSWRYLPPYSISQEWRLVGTPEAEGPEGVTAAAAWAAAFGLRPSRVARPGLAEWEGVVQGEVQVRLTAVEDRAAHELDTEERSRQRDHMPQVPDL